MILDEPIRGVFAYLEYPRLLGLSGFDQMLRRELPRAPLSNLLSIDVCRVEKGGFGCSIPASPWLCTAVATAELVDAEKTVTLASGSPLILPGRGWPRQRPAVPIDEAAANG